MKKEIRSVLFYVLYFICIIFTVSAGVNEGLTRWYSGIPFFVLHFVLIKYFSRPRKYIFLSSALITLAIITNNTLPKNTLLYPILNDGYLLVKEDGYIHHYSDNSAGFYHEEDTGISCTGCGHTKKHKVTSGDKIKVEGIVYNYPDFGFRRAYQTQYGNIAPAEHFELSHDPSPVLKLGDLMYVLLAPLMLTAL